MSANSVKIIAPLCGRLATIEIDGKKIEGVRRILLDASAGDATLLTIELYAKEVSIEYIEPQLRIKKVGSDAIVFEIPFGGRR